MLFSITVITNNDLSLVVLFLGCCFNSYLTHSKCQTLSVNKMNNNNKLAPEEEKQDKKEESSVHNNIL
jgi:hypothetical protein